jgi:translation initiation factor 1
VTDEPFHNPFGALAGLRDKLPAQTPRAAEPEPASAASAPAVTAVKGPVRAVVRLERSGRGGKEVTVVEHLSLRADECDAWLKALKAALGCGGTVEEDTLVLQGDQRKRLPALLTARGVRKVTVA